MCLCSRMRADKIGHRADEPTRECYRSEVVNDRLIRLRPGQPHTVPMHLSAQLRSNVPSTIDASRIDPS